MRVNKPSQSPAFQNLECGDIIDFSVKVERVGRNKGTYATYITCFNSKTNQISKLSFNQIGRTLECFEFEEIDKERHGVWIEKKNGICGIGYECSCCGHSDNKHTAFKGHYCWYCGAVMDEVKYLAE